MNPVKQVSLLSCDGGGLIMSQLNKSIDNCDRECLAEFVKGLSEKSNKNTQMLICSCTWWHCELKSEMINQQESNLLSATRNVVNKI